MKLIIAVINNEDSIVATSALTEKGFAVTRLSTTGGFLMVGNTTLLIGAEEEKIAEIREVLSSCCMPRAGVNPSTSSFGKGLRRGELGEEVVSGGATMFVLSVDSFEKFDGTKPE